jgi:sortase A
MRREFITKAVGFISAVAGLGVLSFVLFPIVSYSVDGSTSFKSYLSPVPGEQILSVESVDYTKASNWFEEDNVVFETAETSKVRFYNLSIPKLGIEDATVAIGGEDLSESLIQYPGTALPGKRGNAVIFGHSILPQFYNPKDYLAIFSTLPTIKKSDQVIVRYDGITYTYKVEEIFEVEPTDLEILAQNITDSYVTLITCTPPGHPLRPKRLIVRARLDPLGTISDNGQNSWN